ncbi:MAG: hypothetical protein JJU29_22245 [Verrucomicrobia bacterium]|nr:hypothetical protein [Verrucomicrobiota bacterium]MCH8511326.1 hypothetical protein [Kiritimatiellia bacterium]
MATLIATPAGVGYDARVLAPAAFAAACQERSAKSLNMGHFRIAGSGMKVHSEWVVRGSENRIPKREKTMNAINSTPSNQENQIMKNEIYRTKRNAFLSIFLGRIAEGFYFHKLFLFNVLCLFKFEGFARIGMRFYGVAGLALLVTGVLSQPTEAAFIQIGDEAGGIGPSGNYVAIPVLITNNNEGAEYTQVDLNSFKPLLDQVFQFGNNTNTYGTLENMINSYSNSEKMLPFLLMMLVTMFTVDG